MIQYIKLVICKVKNLSVEECKMTNSMSVKTRISLAKVISPILLTAALILSVSVFAAPAWAAAPTPNTGWYSPNNGPYEIDTAEKLAGLAVIVNTGSYESSNSPYNFFGETITLTGNINLYEYPNWTPIGDDASYPFAGTFNGDGKTIRNLRITTAATPIGLFGNIATSGTVKDLNLRNVNITVDSTYSTTAGGIVTGVNNGIIQGCTVSGIIDINVSGCNVGGVAGTNSGTVTDSEVSGTIAGNTTNSNVGGIAGNNTNDVKDCKVRNANISGHTAGALAGTNSDSIDDCTVSNVTVNSSSVDINNLVGTGTGATDTRITNSTSSPEEAGGAGCDAGFGFAGVAVLAGGAVIFRRKRLHR
jgi:hypothetical protein